MNPDNSNQTLRRSRCVLLVVFAIDAMVNCLIITMVHPAVVRPISQKELSKYNCLKVLNCYMTVIVRILKYRIASFIIGDLRILKCKAKEQEFSKLELEQVRS